MASENAVKARTRKKVRPVGWRTLMDFLPADEVGEGILTGVLPPMGYRGRPLIFYYNPMLDEVSWPFKQNAPAAHEIQIATALVRIGARWANASFNGHGLSNPHPGMAELSRAIAKSDLLRALGVES